MPRLGLTTERPPERPLDPWQRLSLLTSTHHHIETSKHHLEQVFHLAPPLLSLNQKLLSLTLRLAVDWKLVGYLYPSLILYLIMKIFSNACVSGSSGASLFAAAQSQISAEGSGFDQHCHRRNRRVWQLSHCVISHQCRSLD